MANLRFEVVAEAFKKRPVEVEAPKVRPSSTSPSMYSTARRCTSICHLMCMRNSSM